MTFSSASFIPFLLAVLAFAAAVGRARRWIVLLAASYAFYATWRSPGLLLVLAAVTVVTYGCGTAMERQDGPGRRRAVLWLGLAVNLGTLGALKYAGFAAENLNALADLLGLRGGLPTGQFLPSIGVSYYTLQAASYLLDVHDAVLPAERSLWRFALYLSFFPRLVQGPIERGESLLPQLRDPSPVSARGLVAGGRLFFWGLFQKVVVADRLAPFVDAIFGNVRAHEGLPILAATYLFAAQLYLDFCGYTDMAIGVARMLGVRLGPNFRAPYLATSVADFWRRWHISFSSCLLDYLFRPVQLGLRRWRTWGTPVALLVTFLASGLWHGATWCFVAWGILHGLYTAASVLYQPLRKRLLRALGIAGSRWLKPVQVAVTFHLVCLAWVFFRARTVADALWAVRALAEGLPRTVARATSGEGLEELLYLGQGGGRFLFALALVAATAALRRHFQREDPAATRLALAARTVVYAAMFYLIAFFGSAAQSFIYEQF